MQLLPKKLECWVVPFLMFQGQAGEAMNDSHNMDDSKIVHLQR